jgi:hypothetical protein
MGRAVRLEALIQLATLLLAQPFARKRLFCAALFSRLHVIAMLLDFFDDVFLLHFALETAQSIFQRLTFLNADFSHLGLHRPSDAWGKYCCKSYCSEGAHSISACWHSLLADPSTEVKLCFSGPPREDQGGLRPLGDIPGLLLECLSDDPA